MRALSIVCFPTSFLLACATPSPLDDGRPTPSAAATSTPTASAISPDDPSLSMAPCKVDSECALTTNPGCCSCCPCAEIHATTIEQLKEQEEQCAVVECSMQCDKASVTCPKCVNPAEEGMAARCIHGTCTLVER